MKKFLISCFFVFVSWLGASNTSIYNAGEKTRWHHLSWGLGVVGHWGLLTAGPPVLSVTDIPEYIRSVPVSGLVKTPNNVLRDEKSTMPWSTSFPFVADGGLVTEIKYRSVQLKFIATYARDIGFAGPVTKDQPNFHQQDYVINSGLSGGTQKSITTYYAVYSTLRRRQVCYSTELLIDVSRAGQDVTLTQVLLGYRQLPQALIAENGWDRFSVLEKNNSFILENFISHIGYLGFSAEYADQPMVKLNFYLTAGLSYSTAQQVYIRTAVRYGRPTFFFQMGVTCYTTFYKQIF